MCVVCVWGGVGVCVCVWGGGGGGGGRCVCGGGGGGLGGCLNYILLDKIAFHSNNTRYHNFVQ